MINIGDIITEENYFNAACECNRLGDRHIEKQNNQYIIVANEIHIPTIQEQVTSLEHQYNMCRWQREMILAESSSASDYTKAKAQEIEDLAEQLRD